VSRGPGVLQRRVLETLAAYRRVGVSVDLQWTWHQGSRHSASGDADWIDPDYICAYEQGRRVPMCDLGCTRPELSRALWSLKRQGLTHLYMGTLDRVAEGTEWLYIGPGGRRTFGKSAKYATISKKGRLFLKRQQFHRGEVDAYQWRDDDAERTGKGDGQPREQGPAA
jgi:hypothetical protein